MMTTRATFLKLLFASAVGVDWCSAQKAPETDRLKVIREGFRTLNNIFWLPEIANWIDRPGKDLRGCFDGRLNPPWWSCANVVEAMIDFMACEKSQFFDTQLRALYDGNVLRGSRYPQLAKALRARKQWHPEDEQKLSERVNSLDPQKIHGSQFRNEYLDDSAWWGIAWLRYYQHTKDERYLKTAIAIQEHMARHWREDGGISWSNEPDKRGANAITNSLFVVLSARLYQVSKKPSDLNDALKTLAWEKEVKLYDGKGIVDRPRHRGDYWTYNQGAYLGALEALHAATGEQTYLDEASAVAVTIVKQSGIVREDGILYEKLSTEGWDVGMFKGICARYFSILARSLRKHGVHLETATLLENVLQATAKAILSQPTEQGLYPLEWQPAPRAEHHNFNTQASALIALIAAQNL